jgi:hypothetical protein
MFWCRSEEMQHLVSETNLWLIAARHHPTRGRPVGFRYGLESISASHRQRVH